MWSDYRETSGGPGLDKVQSVLIHSFIPWPDRGCFVHSEKLAAVCFRPGWPQTIKADWWSFINHPSPPPLQVSRIATKSYRNNTMKEWSVWKGATVATAACNGNLTKAHKAHLHSQLKVLTARGSVTHGDHCWRENRHCGKVQRPALPSYSTEHTELTCPTCRSQEVGGSLIWEGGLVVMAGVE